MMPCLAHTNFAFDSPTISSSSKSERSDSIDKGGIQTNCKESIDVDCDCDFHWHAMRWVSILPQDSELNGGISLLVTQARRSIVIDVNSKYTFRLSMFQYVNQICLFFDKGG